MLSSAFTAATIFLSPLEMQNNGTIFFWSVPLIIIISTVYKATKFEKVTNLRFVKESITLSATILGFMALIAVILWVVMAIFS